VGIHNSNTFSLSVSSVQTLNYAQKFCILSQKKYFIDSYKKLQLMTLNHIANYNNAIIKQKNLLL